MSLSERFEDRLDAFWVVNGAGSEAGRPGRARDFRFRPLQDALPLV